MARIAFLIPNLGGGGAERVALTLVGAFAERGHDVDLLVMEKRGELLDLVPKGVRLVDLAAPRTRNVLRPLVRYLRERRPEALQVSMWPLTIIGIAAVRLSRVRTRCMTSDHAILSDHYRRAMHLAIGGSMRFFYPRADVRVTVSEGAAADLARLSGLPRNSFTVIANPVLFPKKLERRREVEELWGEGGRRILTVGQLKTEKDQALLIRAFARLTDKSAKLMMLGEGALRQPLVDLAEREGVADRVVMPGYAADPWPYYASADVFALPSREESFGNVLVEALYAGLPIVSTATVGATAVLEQGRWGRLVPRGDVGAFAEALEQGLSDNPDAARRERAVALSGGASIDAYLELLIASDLRRSGNRPAAGGRTRRA